MKYFNFSWPFYDARFFILFLGLFNASQQLIFSRSNLDQRVPNIFCDSLSMSYFLTVMPDKKIIIEFFWHFCTLLSIIAATTFIAQSSLETLSNASS